MKSSRILRLSVIVVLLSIILSACGPGPSCNQAVTLTNGKSVMLYQWTETTQGFDSNINVFSDDSGSYQATANDDGTTTVIILCEMDARNYTATYDPSAPSGRP